MAFHPAARPYISEEQRLVDKIAQVIRWAETKPHVAKADVLRVLENLYLVHNNRSAAPQPRQTL